MPEGDTIHKLARALRPVLEGRELAELYVRGRGAIPELAGARVDEIAALGKHLLIVLDGRHVLHTHLGMRGKWFRNPPGGAHGAPPERVVVRIATADDRLEARNASVAELLRRVDVRAHPRLSRLGPDLLGGTLDVGEVLRRARARGADGVDAAALLLDQTVACGIGNVYKSELLFLEGIAPRRRASEIDDAGLGALYERARDLMQRNLGGWKRTTTYTPVPGVAPPAGRPRLWVYGRAREPCLRCGTRVRSELLGDQARSTYWCPTCQAS